MSIIGAYDLGRSSVLRLVAEWLDDVDNLDDLRFMRLHVIEELARSESRMKAGGRSAGFDVEDRVTAGAMSPG